jgi:hypothetical protein
MPAMQEVFCYEAQFGEPEMIGSVAGNLKMIWPVTGGAVRGDRLSGTIRAIGGDWMTLHSDGVSEYDARFAIRTRDGALISVHGAGRCDLGPDGFLKMATGQPLGLTPVVHASYRFEAAREEYLWLNRDQFVGVGEVLLDQMKAVYRVYSL